MGDLYERDSRFDEAEKQLRKAEALLNTTYGAQASSAPSYPKLLDDLANLYKEEGRFKDAETQFKRLIDIENAQPPGARPNLAADLGNLGQVYDAESRYAEAEDLIKQSIALYERTYGPQHPTLAIGLDALANIYASENRLNEAAPLQERVLAIREKAYGSDSPDVARELSNLANTYSQIQARRSEAGPLYRRALSIFEAKFGAESKQSTIALSSLGQYEEDQKDFDNAQTHIQAALRLDEEILGRDHPNVITDLNKVAHLEIAKGDYSAAHDYLDRALPLADAKLGRSHETTVAIRVNLADIAALNGDWNEALSWLRIAKADFAKSTKSARTRDLDAFLLRTLRHVADTPGSDPLTNEAFQTAQSAHETSAGSAVAQMAARFAGGSDAMASAIRRKQDIQNQLDALESLITAEIGKPDNKRNDAALVRLRSEEAQLQTQLDKAKEGLVRDFPAYAELSAPAPLSIAQTQTLLKTDEALVFYNVQNTEMFVFAVSPTSSSWARIPLTSQMLDQKVSDLRKGLFDDKNPAGPTPEYDLAAAHALYLALLGPVESIIQSQPKLIIVPAAALTSLPFNVLISKPADPALQGAERYRKAAWLINDKAISVLPSVTSLRALRSFAKESHAMKPFIGFGDPLLKRTGGVPSRGIALQPYASYFRGPSIDLSLLRNGLPALPETADELRSVAKALGASELDVHLGRDATVNAVQTASLEDFKVIDFATHGLVAGEVAGLGEPALVLSLPDQPSADDDGLLTASRVAKLKLDADWAVLSACNTAAGSTPGAEGFSGLARAFFYAGARALLVSNWPVDSEAAARLTTGAFEALQKNPDIGRAEALRRSMKALIADTSSEQNSDPSIWAPFVVVGEGAP